MAGQDAKTRFQGLNRAPLSFWKEDAPRIASHREHLACPRASRANGTATTQLHVPASLHHTAHTATAHPGIFNRLWRTVACGPWLDVTEHSVEYMRSTSVYTFQVTSLVSDTLRRNDASPRSTRRQCGEAVTSCTSAPERSMSHIPPTRGAVKSWRRDGCRVLNIQTAMGRPFTCWVACCCACSTTPKTLHHAVASSSPTSCR
jgi:hypothetical protein